jgi:hypothetical protein
MVKLGLAALLLPPLSAFASPLPSSQRQTVRSLRLEAARSAVAAMAASPEDAKGAAQKGFDGGGLPVTVRVLEPVDTVPLPGEGRAVTPAAPSVPASGDTPRLGDSYHFEGRRSAMPNLTIYTPVKDKPGEDGSTSSPGGGGDWKQTALKALPYVGAAATIGGLFFPPLLFLGGLLLGAWGAMKLLSRD